MVNEEEEEENEEEMMKKEELENQERGRAIVDTRYLKDFYWFSDNSRFLWDSQNLSK